MDQSLQTSAAEILFLSDPVLFEAKNSLYLEVREREGRVLSDKQVQQLPHFISDNKANNQILRREWQLRSRTLSRFEKYLNRKFGQKPLQILDLGCGNGWMSLNLAKRPDTNLWAVDVNLPELIQGQRIAIARKQKNAHFIFADVLAHVLPAEHFDLIILAAAVQYFPNLEALILALKKVLKPGGEIHFLDSPFYPDKQSQQKAIDGTRQYYTSLGVPEMADFYHHHLSEDLIPFGGKNKNAAPIPSLLQLAKQIAPFPWVIISSDST